MDRLSRTEPSADMRYLASMWWDLYAALRQQGFDRRQAFEIVLTMVRTSVSNTPDDEEAE